MDEVSGRRHTQLPLGIGIWTFFAWKSLGVLWALAYLGFSVLWALPQFAHAGALAGEMQSAFEEELAIGAAEGVLTVIGLLLILRRSRFTRWYWIVTLALYCLARLGETLLGPEPFLPAVFLVTGVVWLAYWIFGRQPRELAFGRHWVRPASGT